MPREEEEHKEEEETANLRATTGAAEVAGGSGRDDLAPLAPSSFGPVSRAFRAKACSPWHRDSCSMLLLDGGGLMAGATEGAERFDDTSLRGQSRLRHIIVLQRT
jgi:hypothetical protein